MRRPVVALSTSVALAVTALAGCGTGPGSSAPASSAPTTLTVFAAASLRGTFTTLGRQLETAHPGTRVTFSFAGSADLATQLQQGAPADVVASADTRTMDTLVADRLVTGTPVAFATNTLEIAVPPDNPARITSFADLSKPGVRLVVCAPQVPCGAAAEKIETATDTTLTPVSEENAVTDVLGKVTSGEADAGLVYVTDVRAAGEQVKGIAFEESRQAVNTYPVAVLTAGQHAELADEFVRLVTGSEGRRVLAEAGFGPP